MNIGESIERMYEIKKEKADFNKVIKELDTELEEIERNLIKMIQDQGVCSLSSPHATVTLSSTSYGSIEDFEAFEKYVIDTNSLFLLQRRLSTTAYADLKNAGEAVPGIKEYTKLTLSLRKK
jgi:hypothetical protein